MNLTEYVILNFGNSYQFCRSLQRNKQEPENTFAGINMGNIKNKGNKTESEQMIKLERTKC